MRLPRGGELALRSDTFAGKRRASAWPAAGDLYLRRRHGRAAGGGVGA